MRKILVGVLVCILCIIFSGMAFAGAARQNTGCGLGTILWKDKADNSTVSQSLQATTNGTFGFQTFGITTGTFDCKQPSSFVQNKRLNQFVADNMDNLAKDIAKGQGESLNTLAELMEIPAAERTGFYTTLQANFSNIFTSEKVDASHVIDNIAALAFN